jgi:hypothetical protein
LLSQRNFQFAAHRTGQFREVKELLAKAAQADRTPLQDGLSLPEEITRRQERKAALQKARAEIEARAQARYAVALAEHEEKLAGRAAKKERGQRGVGPPLKAPTPQPGPGDPYNFTDPESRIMKAGRGQHFEQDDNAPAAVAVDSRLMVGERMSQAPNDKQELVPTAAGVVAPVESSAAVLTDSGFYSAAAVRAVEQTPAGQPSGTTVSAALEKKEIVAGPPVRFVVKGSSVEWIKKHLLGRHRVLMPAILPPPALGGPDRPPVGGPVTRPGKSPSLHECLQPFQSVPIFFLPIRCNPATDQPQNMTGQTGHPHPGQNQKTAVVGDAA